MMQTNLPWSIHSTTPKLYRLKAIEICLAAAYTFCWSFFNAMQLFVAIRSNGPESMVVRFWCVYVTVSCATNSRQIWSFEHLDSQYMHWYRLAQTSAFGWITIIGLSASTRIRAHTRAHAFTISGAQCCLFLIEIVTHKYTLRPCSLPIGVLSLTCYLCLCSMGNTQYQCRECVWVCECGCVRI